MSETSVGKSYKVVITFDIDKETKNRTNIYKKNHRIIKISWV